MVGVGESARLGGVSDSEVLGLKSGAESDGLGLGESVGELLLSLAEGLGSAPRFSPLRSLAKISRRVVRSSLTAVVTPID